MPSIFSNMQIDVVHLKYRALCQSFFFSLNQRKPIISNFAFEYITTNNENFTFFNVPTLFLLTG